ncbi:hypothetical protein WMY93_010493 [Mugilogobius chulae]|uniref:Nin one binding (NOB1) Zn-ribbon-like domain-containing protein n=1 Tax=Mugilogobius chulae TaxID=88201 RepID=A0AAW0PHY1_9GOBI
MQNVLIQIGLHVLSVNGMVIKQARNYILRCHACFKTTTHMEKVFCPHCGNKTLKKLAVTVNDDGSIQMHFSKNPKCSTPKDSGTLCRSLREGNTETTLTWWRTSASPTETLPKSPTENKRVDPDYVAGSSPFSQNDIYSRAANLNLRGSQCGADAGEPIPTQARKKCQEEVNNALEL